MIRPQTDGPSRWDDIRDLVRSKRAYASLREGGTRGQKEIGALRDLLDSMQRAGQPPYSLPRLSPSDPPDCIAQTRSGLPAAFEVTEFVSQDAVEINERARPTRGERPTIEAMVMAHWTKATFLEHLADLLQRKDDKEYLGGPFAECVVLIHTDEPLLVRAEAEEWLRDHTFGPYRQLTSAYMLYSYEPGNGYPFQQLRFGTT